VSSSLASNWSVSVSLATSSIDSIAAVGAGDEVLGLPALAADEGDRCPVR